MIWKIQDIVEIATMKSVNGHFARISVAVCAMIGIFALMSVVIWMTIMLVGIKPLTTFKNRAII